MIFLTNFCVGCLSRNPYMFLILWLGRCMSNTLSAAYLVPVILCGICECETEVYLINSYVIGMVWHNGQWYKRRRGVIPMSRSLSNHVAHRCGLVQYIHIIVLCAQEFIDNFIWPLRVDVRRIVAAGIHIRPTIFLNNLFMFVGSGLQKLGKCGSVSLCMLLCLGMSVLRDIHMLGLEKAIKNA